VGEGWADILQDEVMNRVEFRRSFGGLKELRSMGLEEREMGSLIFQRDVDVEKAEPMKVDITHQTYRWEYSPVTRIVMV